MLCSIIVPVYNGEATIERCLDGLANQTIMPDEYELVVVDDGSTDKTAKVIEQWVQEHEAVRCRLIWQPNAGPAAARNRGAKAAKSPILFFTDADCVPEPDWIECMASAFDDPQVVGAKGVYLSDQTGIVPQFVQAEYEDRYDRMRRAKSIDFIDTYSAGYRREAFMDSGGFDPVFPTASVEDQEFSFRLAEKGYRLAFAPDARVRHAHDATVREYARRKYFIGYWKALVTQRYPGRIVRDSHTPQSLKAQIVVVAGLLVLALMRLTAPSQGMRRFVCRAAAVGGALLLMTATPFLFKLARRSLKLALVAPFLLLVRALALGGGYAVGTIRFGVRERLGNGNTGEK